MGDVIKFPGGEQVADPLEDGPPGHKIRIAGGQDLDFDPNLQGARKQVADPDHPACWLVTHIGVIHATELKLFDGATDMAHQMMKLILEEGSRLDDPKMTTGDGFVRDLTMFLFARARRGQPDTIGLEAINRFGERVFPREIVGQIRGRVLARLSEALNPPQPGPRPERELPSLLEVLDHFMPRVK